MRCFYIILLPLLFFNCKSKEVNTPSKEIAMEVQVPIQKPIQISKGDSIINKAIEAHGGKLYDKANYSFIFRKKKYTFKNEDTGYSYSVEFKDDSDSQVIDKLENGNFERSINGKIIKLSEKETDNYSNALNSVIYFTTLPFKLNDVAVNKKYIGSTSIKDSNYHVVKVTFNKEGGGKDHDDQYYYWINHNENTVDYFAYNYSVNGGGVRFRSFYNRKNIDGIIFQDYINWKAPNKTPLDGLPSMFENNKLVKASTIENTQINNLKTKK